MRADAVSVAGATSGEPRAAADESARIDAARALGPQGWTRTQWLKNTLIYLAVRGLLAVVRPLSPRLKLRLGRAVGALAWVVAGGARRLAIANAARIHPTDAVAARGLARRSFLELGALLGDTLGLLAATRAAAPASLTLPFPSEAHSTLDRLRARGRGVVLVTAHLGPWERLAACLVEAGFALTTPVRPSYDPRLDRLLHRPLRSGRGVQAVDRDAPSTPRVMLRALRRGEVVGFLADLHTRVASVRVPFLGAPAWTIVAPARIALRTGAPIVVAIATKRGVVVDVVREPAEPARGPLAASEVVALTAELSRRLGDAVALEPERWIWMHDRWRDAHERPAFEGEVELGEASSHEPSALNARRRP